MRPLALSLLEGVPLKQRTTMARWIFSIDKSAKFRVDNVCGIAVRQMTYTKFLRGITTLSSLSQYSRAYTCMCIYVKNIKKHSSNSTKCNASNVL